MASAHKVGSTWLYNLIKEYFDLEYTSIPVNCRNNPNIPGTINLSKPESKKYLKGLNGRRILKSHSFPPKYDISKIHFITILRDPRDLMISSIFYLTSLDPELGGWIEFRNMNFKDKVDLWLYRNDLDFKLLLSWNKYEAATKVRYEELSSNTLNAIKGVIEEINEEKTNQIKLKKIIARNSFAKNSGGREPGMEDSKSFYRKGISGDWKNYFDADIARKWSVFNDGSLNKMLVELGYEKSMDWGK